MSVQSPDFTAGYYLTCTALGGLIVSSIVYQTSQIRTYISRTRWPKIEELPSRVKYDRPDAVREIHYAFTVWFHKFWNYALHVIGFGDRTVGEILALYVYIGLNLIFLVMPFQSGVGLVQLVNIRCAYVALANAAFVFPLATRNSIFVTLIGVPFERIITLHRWVGRTIFLLLTFHATYQIQSQYTSSLYDLLALSEVNKWGFLAYVSLVIIVIMSHSVFRRFAFEWFYWSHFNFIFFVIFGSLHQNDFFNFTIIGVALYVIDRLVRFFVGLKKIDVISMEAISSGVTRVIFSYPTYYEAGQYMFINIPQLRAPISLLAWHPFSYSSAPSAKDKGAHYASIHVKTQGGFTKALYAKSQGAGQMTSSLKLRIDGPYGKPSLDFKAHRTVLLVAGGVGITPMISILRDLVDRQVTSMPIATQEIYFMWIIPDQFAYSWFGDEIQEIISQSSALPEDKYLLDIKIFFTKATTTPSSQFFAGRPDLKSVFKDIKQFHGSGDIAVGVCGPALMLREVRNAAVMSSDASCLFKVHTETFEL